MTSRADVQLAAYTCPLWHPSAHYRRQYAAGWTEYEIMRGARPWWPGHRQPRQPLLGALNEALPQTWEVYNRLAADHGIDALIWDWYWYHDEPAMHEALEQGFLAATNRERVSFAVMWVNHHWLTLYPTTLSDGAARFPKAFAAPDTAQDMWRSLSYLLARYLHQPNYWRIDGRPVLVIWDVRRMERLIGAENVRRLFAELDRLGRAMGHPGLHLHTPLGGESGGRPEPPDESGPADMHLPLEQLGFSSFGSYTLLPSTADRRPGTEEVPHYDDVVADVVSRGWAEQQGGSRLPYWPSVAPGWDTAPRLAQPRRPEQPDRNRWPGFPLCQGETPAAFEAFVRDALTFVDERPAGERIVTVGCFNEWTEGQYLLPDTDFGHGMLQALARARGIADQQTYFASTGAGR